MNDFNVVIKAYCKDKERSVNTHFEVNINDKSFNNIYDLMIYISDLTKIKQNKIELMLVSLFNRILLKIKNECSKINENVIYDEDIVEDIIILPNYINLNFEFILDNRDCFYKNIDKLLKIESRFLEKFLKFKTKNTK